MSNPNTNKIIENQTLPYQPYQPYHTNTQTSAKHKAIIIVIVVTFIILIGAGLGIYFRVFHKQKAKEIPTSSNTIIFNGPKNINGDHPVVGPKKQFKLLQTINSGEDGFGYHVWTHDAGFLAITDKLNNIHFYKTNDKGEIVKEQTLQIVNNSEFLTSSQIVDGTFAPIFNKVNEVYYLFISVGVFYQFPSPVKCASMVITFQYDTNTENKNALTWIQTNQKPLTHPFFKWNPSEAYKGTFGNRLFCIVDDRSLVKSHALYIQGSEYSSDQPGGNIFYFQITDNSPNPSFQLQANIKDAKLNLINNELNGTLSKNKDKISYLHDFGYSLHVTSGNGNNDVIFVGNPNNQDTKLLCEKGCQNAPFGYIQGYVQSKENDSSWMQPVDPSNNKSFLLRDSNQTSDVVYSSANENISLDIRAFGTGVFYFDSILYSTWSFDNGQNFFIGAKTVLIDVDNSMTVLTNKRFVKRLCQDQKNVANCCAESKDKKFHCVNPTRTLIHYETETNLQGSNLYQYKQNIIEIDGSILFSFYQNEAKQNSVIWYEPVKKDGEVTDMIYKQSFGAIDNSGVETEMDYYGYGQYIGKWYSKTRSTLYLAINDPDGKRVQIYYRSPGL